MNSGRFWQWCIALCRHLLSGVYRPPFTHKGTRLLRTGFVSVRRWLGGEAPNQSGCSQPLVQPGREHSGSQTVVFHFRMQHVPQSINIVTLNEIRFWIIMKAVNSYKFPPVLRSKVGRDSVVCIASRHILDRPGIESRWGRDFSHPSRLAVGHNQPPIQRIRVLPASPVAKARRRPSTPI